MMVDVPLSSPLSAVYWFFMCSSVVTLDIELRYAARLPALSQKSGGTHDALKDLSSLLELGSGDDAAAATPLLMAELEALPVEAGLDIEVYYNQVCACL
jgi:hypothetical protein